MTYSSYTQPMIIGFARMDSSTGFKRDFSPEFIHKIIESSNATILLENEYGSDMGFNQSEYETTGVRFVSKNITFATSDLVVVLTAPLERDILQMKKGSIVLSMLHFDTHPERNNLMRKMKVRAVSLDGILDSEGNRIAEGNRGFQKSEDRVGYCTSVGVFSGDWIDNFNGFSKEKSGRYTFCARQDGCEDVFKKTIIVKRNSIKAGAGSD